MSTAHTFKDRNFLAVIGDEVDPHNPPGNCVDLLQDSVTGLLLAGIGHINQDQKKNFLIVDASIIAPDVEIVDDRNGDQHN
jgi:V-type H+-transporting ATPase subunit F